MRIKSLINFTLCILICTYAMPQKGMQIPGCGEDSDQSKSAWQESIADFINGVANKKPMVGGGFVCVVTGTEGISLIIMALELSEAKQKTEEQKNAVRGFVQQLRKKVEELSCFAQRDKEAYQRVLSAMKRPKITTEEKRIRDSAINSSNIEATEIPIKATELIVEIFQIVKRSLPFITDVLISDVGAGTAILNSSALGFLFFAQSNIKHLSPSRKLSFGKKIKSLETSINKAGVDIKTKIKKSM